MNVDRMNSLPSSGSVHDTVFALLAIGGIATFASKRDLFATLRLASNYTARAQSKLGPLLEMVLAPRYCLVFRSVTERPAGVRSHHLGVGDFLGYRPPSDRTRIAPAERVALMQVNGKSAGDLLLGHLSLEPPQRRVPAIKWVVDLVRAPRRLAFRMSCDLPEFKAQEAQTGAEKAAACAATPSSRLAFQPADNKAAMERASQYTPAYWRARARTISEEMRDRDTVTLLVQATEVIE